MEDKAFIDLLSELAAHITANGKGILEDGSRFRSLFMDFSGNQYRAEAKIISEFLSAEAMTMKTSDSIDAAMLRDMARRFSNDSLYAPGACEMAAAASAWLLGLIDRKIYEEVIGGGKDAAVKASAQVKKPAPVKASGKEVKKIIPTRVKTPLILDDIPTTNTPVPEGLEFHIIDGKSVTITGYTGRAAEVVIPGTINGLPVTAIGVKVFSKRTTIKSVTIPPSVTTIGLEAFRYCKKLRSINIPSLVKKINEFTFANCRSLTSVNLPSSIIFIDKYAFYECRNLKSIAIPSSVKSVDYGAFTKCNDSISVTLSRHTELGWDVFPAKARITYRD